MPKRQDFASLVGATQHSRAGVEIDQFDLVILRLLAEDARRSQRSLAREVGLSPSSISERIARLESTGVITSYSVGIDWGVLGYSTLVHAQIELATGQDRVQTLEEIKEIPELDELWIMAGRVEVVARFRLQSNMHLRELLTQRLWAISGIAKIETSLALAQLVDEPLTSRQLRGYNLD